MNPFEVKNVAWAIDFFNDDPEKDKVTVKNLSRFLSSVSSAFKVHPVCLFPGMSLDGHFPFVEKKLYERLSGVKELHLQSTKIISENIYYPPSLNEEVTALLAYAAETRSDLIVASTYISPGVTSLFLGNFTEELYAQSPVSLFIVDDQCTLRKTYQNVLLPMGPRELSAEDSRIIAGIVNSLEADLTIYDHAYDLTAKILPAEGALGDYLQAHRKKLKDKMDSKLSMQKTRLTDLIKNPMYVSDVNTLSTKESIIQYEKENEIDLVILAGTRSEYGGRIPDSIARHVLNYSSCPVLIIR